MRKILAMILVLALALGLTCACGEGLVGVGYTPVAYLGSQVVAGTNHAFLCQAVTVVPDAVPRWTVVFLYEDLQGNVSLMNIADFDFGALCTYGAEN